MAVMTVSCFSGLLIRRKKKKSDTELKTMENTKNGGLVHPDDAVPAVDSIIEGHDISNGTYERTDEHKEQTDHSYRDLQEKINGEEVILSGHLSDPGLGQKSTLSCSPRLKRTCSNIETRNMYSLYEDPWELTGFKVNNSPLSVKSSFSADRVILRKKSTSQVLPSRSRKLWLHLFSWSHRNPNSTQRVTPSDHGVDFLESQQGEYYSDTADPVNGTEDKFLASFSPIDRVNAWVNSLDVDSPETVDFDVSEALPDLSETGKNKESQRSTGELVKANLIIRSMNPQSTLACICGMGLKVVPTISAFASLREVNLSNNSIGHISPGVFPRSLQSLDLSRNRITSIEGFRDLTKLRVLNLSYNKISRIGHGLANCTLIKQLYMAGNKISHVEGLHRLLKLTVVDFSFNKLTTTKALGQLVANYNSLLVVNLLGNPVLVNVGEDHLRKVVNGLLPKLAFFNKQPVNTKRVAVSKVALGGAAWAEQSRPGRRAVSWRARLSNEARRRRR